ncbi:EAL domain-containing protein [Rubrivivax gelatinosus]|uniref:EAL domain-containing protein n=2 Tax=Rubrivivax gelatinosus TaxID=28068 RepID=UPI00030DAE55|nr:EAL domain-containing protein [Rubrivivax gelatinosus]
MLRRLPMPVDRPPAHKLCTAWIEAIRDAFVVLLPLTLFGVVATVIVQFPWPIGRAWMAQSFGPGWASAAEDIVRSTWGVLGLALAITVAAMLAQRAPRHPGREPLPPIWVAISALVNFMLCVGPAGPLTTQALGSASILTGIAVGLATPTLLWPLARWRPLARLAVGYDSNPVFFHAIRLTLPIAVLGVAVKLAADFAWRFPLSVAGWPEAIQRWLGSRLDADWIMTPALTLLHQVLWLFGVPGGKVVNTHFPAWLTNAGTPPSHDHVLLPLLTGFVHLGGSGATMGLLIAMAIAVRDGPTRRLAQLSWLPAMFNVNELLLFGLPLVLNPRFVLPFLLLPVLLTVPPLIALHAGWLTLLPVQIPWTTPVLVSGWLLTGSWVGVALQLLGLVISTLVYLPFVRRNEAERQARRVLEFHDASAAIVADGQRADSPLRRADHVGVIARGLLQDLERSIGTPGLWLAYQPQHALDGRAIGVEALLRWTHPGYGAVRTDVAIALAEQGGLISRLGERVLDEACACKARWNERGLEALTMSVNVSPQQLGEPGLADTVARVLRRHGLRPGELEIEITESSGIPVSRVADDNLAGLEALGVRLAMDDFGMGHASLLHLRRFRVSAIKIDGSLSRDVMAHPVSADIIRAIAALGHTSGARVIAEFVETREQRDRLAALGCSVFQGYLHSRALPAEDCLDYLLDARRHDAARASADSDFR